MTLITDIRDSIEELHVILDNLLELIEGNAGYYVVDNSYMWFEDRERLQELWDWFDTEVMLKGYSFSVKDSGITFVILWQRLPDLPAPPPSEWMSDGYYELFE